MSDFKNAAAPDEMEALQDEALQAEFVPENEPDQEAAQADGLGVDACGALAGSVFDLIAMRRGEHWRLKSDEAAAVGSALDEVVRKYAPAMGNIGAEAALGLVLVSVVLPRMQGDKKAGENEA